MIIDEKGKLFGKISVIDIIVILVLLVVLIGVDYKLFAGDDNVKIVSSDTFYAVIEADKLRDSFMDYVQPGEVIYEQHGNKIGEIISVRKENTVMVEELANADPIPYTDRYTLFITVKCTGTVNSSGYVTSGNCRIYQGGSLNIQSRLFSVESTVYEVGTELPEK